MAGTDDGFDPELLQELLWAYGPCGQEDAVREVCRREIHPHADELWTDAAGNLIAKIGGTDPDAPATRILAHLDELSMLVKRIEPGGTLRLTPLGTMYPANFGLGPVTILGDHETLTGILALGSEHTTQETPQVWQTKPDQGDKALDWPDVYVFTGVDNERLADAGIGPGTRVCIDRTKRTLIELGDYVGCYFMDDRAAVLALLMVARRLKEAGRRPAGDLYLVFTTNEEIGGVGAAHACRILPGDLTLAVEVGPTEAEYRTTVTGGPIVAYSDAMCVYDKSIADRLCDITRKLGYSPQAAVLGAFESDASHTKASGLSPQAGLLCLPTLSTHGYEVIARTAITEVTDVLVEFVDQT